jgi:hypothetical protein
MTAQAPKIRDISMETSHIKITERLAQTKKINEG